MPKLTLAEAQRLLTNKEVNDNTHQGTSITGGLGQLSYNSSTWTRTFFNDFLNVGPADGDVRHISDTHSLGTPTVNGTFWAKGRYDSAGNGSIAQFTYVPGAAPEGSLYYQHDASVLGLGNGNFSNSTGSITSSIEAMRIKTTAAWHQEEDGVTDTWEGFCQRYGYFKAKIKLPSWIRTDTAVSWCAFWLYTNVWSAPDHPPVEIDLFEIYIGSRNNVTPEGTSSSGTYNKDVPMHVSFHHHDTYKSLLSPGFISRDRNSSNIVHVTPNTNFGTDSTFNWNDAFHDFGALITPEWFITFLDDHEVCRWPMLDVLHQKFYTLLTHEWLSQSGTGTSGGNWIGTGAKTGQTGFVEDVINWMLIDNVEVRQNPDWVQAGLTVGGSLNAWTVTTGLAMTGSYAAYDGRILVLNFPAANTTTAPMLNANSLGNLVIKKLSDYDGVKNPPYTGTPVALAASDITHGSGTHNLKLDVTNNCWILMNPANPFSEPRVYQPPAYSVPAAVVDVTAVEGQLMEKWAGLRFLPDDHAGKLASTVDTTLIWPRVAPNKTFDVVVGAPAGTVVGTVPYLNTPTNTPRAAIDSTKYNIDPATGAITVAAGATITAEDIEVSWWSPGVPTPAGANICTVSINARPNVPFDLALFFGTNLGGAWEFDKLANVVTTGGIDGSGNPLDGEITSMQDSSGHNLDGTPPDSAHRPSWSATGLNGHPCAVNTINTHRLILTDPIIVTPLNAMTSFAVWTDGTASIAPNQTHRHCAPYDYTVPHSLYFEWTSLEVFCWINGSSVAVVQQTGAMTSNGWMFFFGQLNLPTATSAAIYGASESDAALFTGTSGTNGMIGKCGILAGGKASNTTVGREKLIADAHWRYGYESLLPAGHTYKSVAPNLYG